MTIESVAVVLVGNLNVTVVQLVLLITALGSMIFMALDLRFGLLMLFFMFGVETLVFWAYGVTTAEMTLSTLCLLSSFVALTLSLLLVSSKQAKPGGII
jgi:hypothetical protein